MYFPVAGIEIFALVTPIAAFVISFFTSMTGVSGAFLLRPFQVSVLGFVSPAVSSTNLLYNVVGTPGGVLRYFFQPGSYCFCCIGEIYMAIFHPSLVIFFVLLTF